MLRKLSYFFVLWAMATTLSGCLFGNGEGYFDGGGNGNGNGNGGGHGLIWENPPHAGQPSNYYEYESGFTCVDANGVAQIHFRREFTFSLGHLYFYEGCSTTPVVDSDIIDWMSIYALGDSLLFYQNHILQYAASAPVLPLSSYVQIYCYRPGGYPINQNGYVSYFSVERQWTSTNALVRIPQSDGTPEVDYSVQMSVLGTVLTATGNNFLLEIDSTQKSNFQYRGNLTIPANGIGSIDLLCSVERFN